MWVEEWKPLNFLPSMQYSNLGYKSGGCVFLHAAGIASISSCRQGWQVSYSPGTQVFLGFLMMKQFFPKSFLCMNLIVCSTKIKHGWKCYFVGMLGSTPVAKKSWPKRNTWFHWTRIGGGGRCEISWWVSLEVKYFLQEFFSKWSRTTECLELIPRSFGLI